MWKYFLVELSCILINTLSYIYLVPINLMTLDLHFAINFKLLVPIYF